MEASTSGTIWDLLLLSYPLAHPVKTVAAYDGHGSEVVGRAETAGGEVALRIGISINWISLYRAVLGWWAWAYLILHGLVAAGWREVLSHSCCGGRVRS